MQPQGIAVDLFSRNLYWTDSSRNRVEVSKLNGDFRRTILWMHIDSPKSIVIDPKKVS